MFEKILYPTDFSDVARKALEYIIRLKDAGAKEVVVLHVIDERSLDMLSVLQTKDIIGIVDELEEKAKEEIGMTEDNLKKSGLKVKVLVRNGIPFREIIRVADEEKVSVIILGSHGKSNLKEMLLGSVSEKVVRKAKEPVLVIKR
jgi:nucleotide-binding universal stress UspA family protein